MKLVVVSVDIVVSIKFTAYIDRLIVARLLYQIFVDKRYIAIIDISY